MKQNWFTLASREIDSFKFFICGGGAQKFKDFLQEELLIEVVQMDELECLIKGVNLLCKLAPTQAECFRLTRNFGFPQQRRSFDPPSAPTVAAAHAPCPW